MACQSIAVIFWHISFAAVVWHSWKLQSNWCNIGYRSNGISIMAWLTFITKSWSIKEIKFMDKSTPLEQFYLIGSILVLGVMFFYWLDSVVYSKVKRRKAGVWAVCQLNQQSGYDFNVCHYGLDGYSGPLGRSYHRPGNGRKAEKKVKFDFCNHQTVLTSR